MREREHLDQARLLDIRPSMAFALETMILDTLAAGTEERFVLPVSALPRLGQAFDRVGRRASAASELHRVLQLVLALRDELRSPTAAAQLRTLADRTPGALAELRRRLGAARSIEETRRFLAKEGRGPVLRAPPPPPPWKSKSRALRATQE